MGFLFTIHIGFLFTIVPGIQFTISTVPFWQDWTSGKESIQYQATQKPRTIVETTKEKHLPFIKES